MCEEVKTYIFQYCGFELNNTDPEADFRDLGSGSYLIQITLQTKNISSNLILIDCLYCTCLQSLPVSVFRSRSCCEPFMLRLRSQYINKTLYIIYSSVAEPGPVEPKLFET